MWCDDQRAYCAIDANDLQAVNLADGKQAWRVNAEPGGRVGALLAADGVVYLSDGAEAVSAYDAATGKIRWTCVLPNTPEAANAPVLAGGTLFIAGRTSGKDGKPCVHAVDAAAGSLKWTFTDPAYREGSDPSLETCQLSTDGRLVFVWLKNTLTALPAA